MVLAERIAPRALPGLRLAAAVAIALEYAACVQHGDLVMRPKVIDGRLFFIVGDGLMPVTPSWVPSSLADDPAWTIADDPAWTIVEADLASALAGS